MLKQRINYWSNSWLADFIRGEKKPYALPWEEWDKWRDEQKKKRPIRFWISDKLLNKIQNFIYFPCDVYYTIKIYIKNRYIDKVHYLNTGLAPGQYYEIDTRIIHGLFNELVDFVEVELAWKHLIFTKYSGFWERFIFKRSSELGLEYLNWAASLVYDESYGLSRKDIKYGKPTLQAESSKEIIELYNWWKNRPYRPDPYDVIQYNKENKKEKAIAYKKINKIESDYEKEDEKMLIKLIKIRGSLWS
jgi:hypothetical protein